MRDFFAELETHNASATISDEAWRNAKNFIIQKYGKSENLEGVLRLIQNFEETTADTKYISDFEMFVTESQMEDFF